MWLQNLSSIFNGFDLASLARKYQTDKSGGHAYAGIYQHYFRRFKFKRIKLLEIGIGGYEAAYAGGGSLRMWRRYFPFAMVYGIDIHDKTPHQERRIHTFRGSQSDTDFLRQLASYVGELDIIIDDGSHHSSDVIASFKALFPQLKSGGLYVIEDTQTSYWEACGGSSTNLRLETTTMNFFKARIDGLNYREFMLEQYEPTPFDEQIKSLHFYHNMIVVEKGDNTEESNVLRNNTLPEVH